VRDVKESQGCAGAEGCGSKSRARYVLMRCSAARILPSASRREASRAVSQPTASPSSSLGTARGGAPSRKTGSLAVAERNGTTLEPHAPTPPVLLWD